MDDNQQKTSMIDTDAIDESNPEVKHIMDTIRARTAEAEGLLADLKAETEKHNDMFEQAESEIREAAQSLQTAIADLDVADQEAADELSRLNLQFAEDMAKLDEEDAAEEKSEEEEGEKETE